MTDYFAYKIAIDLQFINKKWYLIKCLVLAQLHVLCQVYFGIRQK